VVVRSSAADEDGNATSSAGEYDSVLNIPSDSKSEIINAINIVISSYKKKRNVLTGDKVIVQEMVKNISMSGVVFTHDLNTGAPYYVVNYDDKSGLTDTVTSGNCSHANRVLYIYRNSIDSLHSARFIKLVNAIQELEQLIGSVFLDIEFALDEELTPYLLQVRKITTHKNWNLRLAEEIDLTLKKSESVVIDKMKKVDGVYGDTTVFGQMPDWNPIEMIGRVPHPLAYSIYQKIITNSAWSKARSLMGYCCCSRSR